MQGHALRLKKELRAALRAAYRTAAPCDLSQQVRLLPQYRQAKTVALYYGMGAEVSLTGLLDDRTVLLLPRCDGQRMVFCRYEGALVSDAYGIPAPVGEPYEGDIDLMLVPALAFDHKGYRLGRGGGYYDRALANYTGLAVGVIREEFVLDTVPRAAHDARVAMIVTEKGVYGCADQVEK